MIVEMSAVRHDFTTHVSMLLAVLHYGKGKIFDY